MFKTIEENVQAEIVEKKSKFIANIFYIESEEEAEQKIKEIQKKYFDARHNCYAYSVYSKSGKVERFSDDGEPSGTAGAPMLNILSSNEITNVVVIVTRYFGGILLGTGGLVRAYTTATNEAISKSKLIEKELGLEAVVEVSYSDLEKCKYYLKQNNIFINDVNYEENVSIKIEISHEKLDFILKNIKNFNFDIINIEKLEDKFIKIN